MLRCECGATSAIERARCDACGRWNSFAQSGRAPRRGRDAARAVPIGKIATTRIGRLRTGMREIDRALGGGLGVGKRYLMSGGPGAGKSTLLLQWAAVAPTLYITGEEDEDALADRAARLGLDDSPIEVLETDCVDDLEKEAPGAYALIIADSLQSFYSDDAKGIPGSVTQVQTVGHALKDFAKTMGATLIIVGQLNSVDQIAGPRTVEHLVDGSLSLSVEGDGDRMFGVMKHRHGPAPRGVRMEMTSKGLIAKKERKRKPRGSDKRTNSSVKGQPRLAVVEES